MILIPGLASSGATWDTSVARYRTRFTCHVLTVAGFAGVSPIDGPLLPAVRRDLAEFHFALHDTSRHFIMWDDPAWFFGEVDAFLADPLAPRPIERPLT